MQKNPGSLSQGPHGLVQSALPPELPLFKMIFLCGFTQRKVTMFVTLLTLFAEDPPQGGQPSWFPMVGIFLIIGVFFFMMTRSMRRQERERKAMAGSLEKNDKVLTAAGIYGTVVSVSDKEDEVVVRVDDNTRLRMTKGSIARNLTKEETLAQKKG
jgi:preprotein translocase subunit YajC